MYSVVKTVLHAALFALLYWISFDALLGVLAGENGTVATVAQAPIAIVLWVIWAVGIGYLAHRATGGGPAKGMVVGVIYVSGVLAFGLPVALRGVVAVALSLVVVLACGAGGLIAQRLADRAAAETKHHLPEQS